MEAMLLDGCRHPDEVGALFEAYTRDLLRQAPDFAGYLARQDYSHELSHLEEKYGRPRGRLYLLRCGGVPAGTVASSSGCMFTQTSGDTAMPAAWLRPFFQTRPLSAIARCCWTPSPFSPAPSLSTGT